MMLPSVPPFLLVVLLLCVIATAQAQGQDDFNEMRFRTSMENAMTSVQQILDTTRNPKLAEDEDHQYNDKYALAEFLTNTMIAAQTNVLELLFGLDQQQLAQVHTLVHKDQRAVTLRFQAEQTTRYLGEKETDVVTSERVTETEELEITTDGQTNDKTKTVKTKVKRKIWETQWQVDLKLKLVVFDGPGPNNDKSNVMTLQTRDSSRKYVTTSGSKRSSPPADKKQKELGNLDLNLTWLLQMLSKEDKAAEFSIDRFHKSTKGKETCRTPRRNQDVKIAIEFLKQLQSWAFGIISFFQGEMQQLHMETTSDLGSRYWSFIDEHRKLAKSLFLPTLPLLENSTVLSALDLDKLLTEQSRRIQETNNQLVEKKTSYPTSLISALEAKILVACFHMNELVHQYLDSINYIEHMLKTQLIRAIGKEVTAQDFDVFMKSYYPKLFGGPAGSNPYAPNLFSYAVRRPNHYPDGILSIEAKTYSAGSGATTVEPVQTLTRRIPYYHNNATTNVPPTISIPINAATSVEIKGDRYLHGWLQHRFGMASKDAYYNRATFHLAARAHQFSNFMLVVGTMAGATKFKPSSAIILQNKDEVLIPLLTEVIPSAKQFKDAIASLSPQQQQFAKAFRAMQLESSIFGVCVIQLKPQLELLLGLSPHSLTKEIQLTQDLMSLFVEYQIPSDLLSVHYDLVGSTNSTAKLDSVKANVQAVKDVIQNAKEEQLEQEKLRKEMYKQKQRRMWDDEMRPPSESPSESPSASPSGSPSGGNYQTLGRSVNTIRSRSASFESFEASSAELLQAASYPGPTRSTPMPSSSSSTTTSDDSYQEQEESASEESTTTTTAADDDPAKPGRKPTTTTSAKTGGGSSAIAAVEHDFTLLPKILDAQIEQLDPDGSLRSTIVKPDSHWERTQQENLLMPPQKEILRSPTIEMERKKAFDLLDALSRSGSLPIEQSELHVVIALSHCFEDDLMSTVIADNVNPIEKVERSSLLLASTIHGRSIKELVGHDETTLQRLLDTFPALMGAEEELKDSVVV